MPTLTRFTVQSYRRNDAGDLVAEDPLHFHHPDQARQRLEYLATRRAGVIAYKWMGNMRTGEMGRISLLCRSGVVPKYAAIALGLDDEAA